MPALFAQAAGEGPAREIFLEKLGAIHNKVQEVRARRAEEASRAAPGPAGTIYAADPT